MDVDVVTHPDGHKVGKAEGMDKEMKMVMYISKRKKAAGKMTQDRITIMNLLFHSQHLLLLLA